MEQLQRFDYEKLSEQAQLSHQLFEKQTKEKIEAFKWRHHGYPVNQMFGVQSSFPAFMINIHRIASKQEARDYISRLQASKKLIDDLNKKLRAQMRKGIIPPKFVFAKVFSDAENIITGIPFNGKKASPLLKDFSKKVNRLVHYRS